MMKYTNLSFPSAPRVKVYNEIGLPSGSTEVGNKGSEQIRQKNNGMNQMFSLLRKGGETGTQGKSESSQQH